jgi:hypothetical protein
MIHALILEGKEACKQEVLLIIDRVCRSSKAKKKNESEDGKFGAQTFLKILTSATSYISAVSLDMKDHYLPHIRRETSLNADL